MTLDGTENEGHQTLRTMLWADGLPVALYREDKASVGRAAELCQTLVAPFMDFVAKPLTTNTRRIC